MLRILILAAALCSTNVDAKKLNQAATVLWDHWYIITIEDHVPYAYYNEIVKRQDDQIQYQQHLWKLEEGYINEEHLGVFSKDDEGLSPLYYSFYSTYKAFETKIDGFVETETSKNARQVLKVKVTQKKEESPLIKIVLSTNTSNRV